ncbi:Nuclear factor interleukin-3-regulated protein [Amphibalanus amphitrite]|uniref:Nuclear factor interleukin-3-regulated protein n=1 Tax=Amphibalanus amphitrite TaxID=1232801 RepID=A0A6A4WU31_AMPAM|nr:Nuclear factor interleukin-3-regulated protein [Amphibalanus amphitrite]
MRISSMMVTEGIFGTVQYGDMKVRYAPAPQVNGYYYQPPSGQESKERLPVPPLEALQTPAPQEANGGPRKQREFTKDTRKDDSYWDRRRRNNEAAKRSREKRRFNDMILETRVAELTRDNYLLRAQLNTIRDKFGIIGENHINQEEVLAQMPTMDRILGFSKRPKPRCWPAAHQFRPVTPPSAPAAPAGHEPNPFVYRQQSLREPRAEPAVPEQWRPRSADSARLTPDFTAAVNLTKAAAEPAAERAGSPEQRLPLKLRHKPRLGAVAVVQGGAARLGLFWGRARLGPLGPVRRRRLAGRQAEALPRSRPPSSAPQIRSQLERLSMEVATLRSLLGQNGEAAAAGAPTTTAV